MFKLCKQCQNEFWTIDKKRAFCNTRKCNSKIINRRNELQKIICEPTAKGKDYKDYLKVI